MSDQPPPISDDTLHAYVDGRLDAAHSAEIGTRLATDAVLSARVQAWREQNQALHALFDPVLDEPVPARLTQILTPPARARWLHMAAAIGWLAVGGMLGWAVHGKLEPATPIEAVALAQRAAVAHVVYASEVQHPVEVKADQEQHLVHWLSKRLGTELRVPDLNRFGYQLVGGRLLPGDKGPAAQFMYQEARGTRLTLYVAIQTDVTQETAFRYEAGEGVNVLYWVDHGRGFALAGETDRATLLRLGHAAYETLSF